MGNGIAEPGGHTIFLLGAGASKDAGFPLVAGLTNKLRERLPGLRDSNGKMRAEFPELFDAIGLLDPKAKKNYERFFEWLALLRQGRKPPFHKLVRFDLKDHLVAVASELAFNIADPIRDVLRDCHQKQSYQPGYLAKLCDFAKQSRLDVFTLNYDLCVEDACAKHGIDIITGFCRESGRWSPIAFPQPRPGH